MCHARSPFFISHWSTIMWPVYFKTKQNRSHVIFLPKQWLPKTYTKAANWAWPQCFLPPGPTGVSITESSNSPFQILIKLNSCLLSYNFFICVFFFSSFYYFLHLLLPCWSPDCFDEWQVVSSLTGKSLHVSWVQIFVSLLCKLSYLNFLCSIAFKCKKGIIMW